MPMADKLGLSLSSGGLFCLLGLLDRDGVPEFFELVLEPAGAVLWRVALALPVGPEFAERDLVADDVEVRDEDVVTGRTDRFGFPAPAAELRVVSSKIGALRAGGGFRGLGQRLGQPSRTGSGPTGPFASG